jgi:hypothetical protein
LWAIEAIQDYNAEPDLDKIKARVLLIKRRRGHLGNDSSAGDMCFHRLGSFLRLLTERSRAGGIKPMISAHWFE